MQKVWRDPLFWLTMLATAAGFWWFTFWQQQYLGYFFYGWAAVRQLPIFTEPALFLGLLSGGVAGYTAGQLAVLTRWRLRAAVRRSGFLAGIGAALSALLSACLACNLSLLAAWLGGGVLAFLHRSQLILQFVSLGLLLLAAWQTTQLARGACRVRNSTQK